MNDYLDGAEAFAGGVLEVALYAAAAAAAAGLLLWHFL